MGTRFSFRVTEMFWNLTEVMVVAQYGEGTRSHCTLKWLCYVHISPQINK